MTLIERNMLTPPQGEGSEPPSVAHVLSSAFKAVRRHLWLLGAFMGVCLFLSLISIVAMTPVYQATTTIYIDPRESRGFQEAGGILLSSDALVVDSEVEILMSNALAERVVDKLGLAALDPAEEEEPKSPNFTARLKSLFVSAEDEDQTGVLSPEEAAKRRAVSKLRRAMEIGRLGNTYVIEITAKHTDKQKVAAIANAYAEEYLVSGLEVQAERLAQLNSWSSTALREAVEELELAEQEVNQFRLVNQIDSGDRQVVGTELSDLNLALVTLRNERFDKELLLERVRKVLSDGSTATDVTNMGVPEIEQIRAEILQAEIEVARMTANGTRSSLQASIITGELDAMKSQLDLQYQRVARELENQIEFSLAEEKRLSDRGDALRADVATVSEKEAKLRELQMRANGARAVYQALLTRFHETSDDFAYNTSSARVLTAAQVPAGPSAPQTSKILALGLVAGVFLAMVAIFLLEQLDNRIRQPRQIEALGLRYIGAVPRITGVSLPFGLSRFWNRRDVNAPALSGGKRDRDMAQLSYAVDFPLSEFSETIRSIVFDAVASNPSAEKAQIIAVTSTSPGQGKSTLAANIAAYYAKQGKRAHLIDFDLRNPDLSQVFATRRVEGKSMDGANADAAHQAEMPITDFDFSGRVEDAKAADMIELINPGTIVTYLESLKAEYDVVVLDIGSLSESSDARMCADLADYVVLAVRWGFNTIEQFELALARGLNRTGKSVGAVLTMVPSSAELEKTAPRDGPTRPQVAA
nr:Wzz/FepE/Etk N-terminal domain-containing protein [Roseovarius sp. W115]MDV2929086.1 Wzz/FepE/Etk N-terminal domain-containing protein [Roseovarius sp. W115]